MLQSYRRQHHCQSCLGNEFDGLIDDLIIFNRSLSAEQVQGLYEKRTDIIVSQEVLAEDIWKACVTLNDGSTDLLSNCSNNVTIYSFDCYDVDGDLSYNSSSHPICDKYFDCDDTNATIIAPNDDTIINTSQVLCSGDYLLNDAGDPGLFFFQTGGSLDCDGANMTGNGAGVGMTVTSNYKLSDQEIDGGYAEYYIPISETHLRNRMHPIRHDLL